MLSKIFLLSRFLDELMLSFYYILFRFIMLGFLQTNQIIECSMNKNGGFLNDTSLNMFSHKNIRIDDQLIECSMDNNKGFEVLLV